MKNCGTCKRATFAMTNHKPPRFVKDAAAKCQWKLDIVWPDSVPMQYRNVTPNYVTPDMGTTCPCHLPRENS